MVLPHLHCGNQCKLPEGNDARLSNLKLLRLVSGHQDESFFGHYDDGKAISEMTTRFTKIESRGRVLSLFQQKRPSFCSVDLVTSSKESLRESEPRDLLSVCVSR